MFSSRNTACSAQWARSRTPSGLIEKPAAPSALYAYFMQGVAAVKRANRENDLRWPFGIRSGLSLWNMAFVDGEEYKPDPAASAQWNRGAYIVEGLGHCGSCHTPRGMALQEKAMSETGSDGKSSLEGSTIDAWHAPSLRNLWPAPEFRERTPRRRSSRTTCPSRIR